MKNMGKMKMGTMSITIELKVSWRTVVKMMLIGRYPAAILARAVADRIRNEL